MTSRHLELPFRTVLKFEPAKLGAKATRGCRPSSTEFEPAVVDKQNCEDSDICGWIGKQAFSEPLALASHSNLGKGNLRT